MIVFFKIDSVAQYCEYLREIAAIFWKIFYSEGLINKNYSSGWKYYSILRHYPIICTHSIIHNIQSRSEIYKVAQLIIQLIKINIENKKLKLKACSSMITLNCLFIYMILKIISLFLQLS